MLYCHLLCFSMLHTHLCCYILKCYVDYFISYLTLFFIDLSPYNAVSKIIFLKSMYVCTHISFKRKITHIHTHT